MVNINLSFLIALNYLKGCLFLSKSVFLHKITGNIPQIVCHPPKNVLIFMFISDDHISLRIAEPEDASQIYTWENDRSVWRVSETSAPLSLFQIEQFLLGNDNLSVNRQLKLMVTANATNQVVGCIDLFDYDAINGRIGIGILIDGPYRRKGYAISALTLCINYLFNDLLVHQVHCLIDAQNTPSQRLFRKLGFKQCGRRKEWIRTPQGYLDALFFQRINP